MALEWRDCTSYSRGDRDRTPRTWDARASRFRLVVTRGHVYHPDCWVMHMGPGAIAAEPLGACSEMTADQAKAAAEGIARGLLAEALAAFD